MKTGLLKRDFARRVYRAAAVGMLGVMGACAPGTPTSRTGAEGAGQSVDRPVDPNINCNDKGALVFTFENSAAPVLFGQTGRGMFHDDNSRVAERFYAVTGRQKVLLEDPVNMVSWYAWLAQLDEYKNASTSEKALAVDELVDKTIRYVTDKRLYGEPDYDEDYDRWAAPVETLTALLDHRRGWGDCEDIAFLKLDMLDYLGVPPDKAYAVFLNIKMEDKKKNGGHMIVMVDIADSSAGGQKFVVLNNDEGAEGHLDLESDHKDYTVYHAMNKRGVLALPGNSVPSFGTPKAAPRACLPPVNQNDPILKK